MQVSGAAELARVSAILREAGDKRLQAELRRAALRSARHVEQAVRSHLPRYLPGAYERVMAQALDAKLQLRSIGRGARVTALFTADGAAGNRRHIDAMERGTLEHPVYGRTRRTSRRGRFGGRRIPNPWVKQRIRPGFVTEPGMAARPQARREFDEAVGRVADQVRKAI